MPDQCSQGDDSFWRYVRGSFWVVVIFWLAAYGLATVLDDAMLFLSVPLPVLYLISQLLITLYVVPPQRTSILRRVVVTLGVAASYGLFCVLVMWPVVARLPWGWPWYAEHQVLLALSVAWLASYTLTRDSAHTIRGDI